MTIMVSSHILSELEQIAACFGSSERRLNSPGNDK